MYLRSKKTRRSAGGTQHSRRPPTSHTHVATSFFFSSRRRHTTYWRDWSSDVCSSDLLPTLGEHLLRDHLRRYEDADGNDNHLVQQPYAGDEVGYGIYRAKYVADDEGGEYLGVPGSSRVAVGQVEGVGIRRELPRPALPRLPVHTSSLFTTDTLHYCYSPKCIK